MIFIYLFTAVGQKKEKKFTEQYKSTEYAK